MEKTDTRKLKTTAQQKIGYPAIRLEKQDRIKRYFKHPEITYAGAAI